MLKYETKICLICGRKDGKVHIYAHSDCWDTLPDYLTRIIYPDYLPIKQYRYYLSEQIKKYINEKNS